MRSIPRPADDDAFGAVPYAAVDFGEPADSGFALEVPAVDFGEPADARVPL